MTPHTTVDKKKRTRVISVRLPADRAKLLEAVGERRGDGTLSETITAALDRFLEQELAAALDEAA